MQSPVTPSSSVSATLGDAPGSTRAEVPVSRWRWRGPLPMDTRTSLGPITRAPTRSPRRMW
jgi:hypothetical protein